MFISIRLEIDWVIFGLDAVAKEQKISIMIIRFQ